MNMQRLIDSLGKFAGKGRFVTFCKIGISLILLMSVFILASWLPEIAPGSLRDWFNKGNGGIVIIDSPEIYSRERLVNDRFRQVSWLEDELEKSPELPFGNQAISDLHKIMRLDTSLGVSTNGADTENQTASSADDSAQPNSNDKPGVSVSPSERFRDVRAYREEIRTEMMETLLDDRHDIKGNTLYRLKFDTTVIPQENTDKMVVIQVKLARGGFCDPVDSDANEARKRPEHAPCISLKAMHKSWLRQTEEKINAGIEGTINAFRARQLSTADFTAFVEYLQRGVSPDYRYSSITRNLESISSFNSYEKNCLGNARRTYSREPDEADDNRKNREFEIRSCPKEPVSAFYFQQNRLDPITLNRYDKVRQLLARYYREKLDGTEAYVGFKKAHDTFSHTKFAALKADIEKGQRRWVSPISHRDRGILADPHLAMPGKSFLDPEKIGSEVFDLLSKKPLNAITESDLQSVYGALPAAGPDSSQPTYRGILADQIVGQADQVIDEAIELVASADINELVLLRYAVAGMWIDRYSYTNSERQAKCENLYRNKLAVFDPKSLSCLAHLEITAKVCEDAAYCTVKVTGNIPGKRQKYICEGKENSEALEKNMSTETIPAYDWCNVGKTFKRLLGLEEAYYSYAVTPKESAQRVLTIASERRQKQLALSLIASSSKNLDPATVTSITKAISESATQIEQIQRKPLILSFGRGQPVYVEDVGNPDKPANGIDFGWIIGPKYLFSNRNNNKIQFYHAPVQNSLSAVISVPSWWTALDLEIDTCWVNPKEISQIKRSTRQGVTEGSDRSHIEALCDPRNASENHKVDVNYLIRLPGSAEELPRKFGYEIERVPAITNAGILADFYVGQAKASLIIQGHELWRSTVVTMGHQKADNIEVLPNMKGIIATFNRVDMPGQKIKHDPEGRRGHTPEDCYVESEVIVWTSEGRTPRKQLFARIHANPALDSGKKSQNKQGSPIGFGDCSTATFYGNESTPRASTETTGTTPDTSGPALATPGDPAQTDQQEQTTPAQDS